MPPRRILVIKQTSFAVTHGRLSSVMYDFIRSLPVIFFFLSPFSLVIALPSASRPGLPALSSRVQFFISPPRA